MLITNTGKTVLGIPGHGNLKPGESVECEPGELEGNAIVAAWERAGMLLIGRRKETGRIYDPMDVGPDGEPTKYRPIYSDEYTYDVAEGHEHSHSPYLPGTTGFGLDTQN